MRHVYFGIYVLMFLVFSCSNEPTSDPLDDFSKEISFNISPSRIIDLEKFDVFKPEIVYKLDSGYIVKNQTDNNMISRIYTSPQRVIHGINRGEAPNELVSPSSFIQKDNDIYIYDIAKRCIYRIDFLEEDSIFNLAEYKQLKVKERPFLINLVSKGLVASGIFNKAWIAFIDDSDKIVSTLSYPSFKQIDNFTDIEKASLFLSTLIAIKPNEEKIVCATQKCGVLSFCDIEEKKIKEYKQIKYYGPKVGTPRKEGNTTIAFDRDNKIGFCGVACDDNYVFVLYSGRTFNTYATLSHHCEHILIYDWSGKPIKHLILEKPLYTLSYDSKKKVLYGIGYNPEGIILEYNLPDL